MNHMSVAWEKLLQTYRICTNRLRAVYFRARGAHVGKKVVIGRRVIIERPWQVVIGNRVVIENDVYLKMVSPEARIEICDFSFIGRGCQMDVSMAVRIGSHSLIAPGCFVTDHSHKMGSWSRIDQQGCQEAAVSIGEDVWIGANCTILPGVTISDGAVVGAGAVVAKSVGPMQIVVGVPARKIGTRSNLSIDLGEDPTEDVSLS